MTKFFGNQTARIAGIAALLILVVLMVLTVQILLAPLVAAFFVVYLFEPAVTALEKRGVARGRSFLILFGGSLAVVAALLVFAPSWLVPEPVVPSRETFMDRLAVQLIQIEHWIVGKAPMLRSLHLADEATTRLIAMGQGFAAALPSLITALSVNLILVPFIAYFLVRDGGTLKKRIIEYVPNRYFETALVLFYKIDDQIGGYLRGRLIGCTMVGLLQLTAMIVANFFVPQPQMLVIAIVCGVTNLIPYVGPALGAAFGMFLYLGSGANFASCGAFLATVAFTHLIDNVIIAPAVLAKNVDLHPLTVVIVLFIGGEWLGVLGLLIAIPVAASLKVIAAECYSNYRAQTR
jgi:predicted PurR-regulated permease PerM